MKLVIVSHTPHYRHHGSLVAWGPTVREIDQLARVFSEIVHVAPLHAGPAPRSSLPYLAKSIRIQPVRPSGGPSLVDKLSILTALPHYMKTIWRESTEADVAHIRCPAAISLAALFLFTLRASPARRWAKYAGNWQPDGREPIAYRVQRWLLAHRLHRGTVTVNGHWSGQSRHIYSFFNPSFLPSEIASARKIGLCKSPPSSARLLFVGRLEASKGAHRALSIAARLKCSAVPLTLEVVGDGPERAALELQARALGLEDRVFFHGWLSRDALSLLYEQAHFLLLPSASEGWPKVISEAMAYGAIPVAAAVSCIPEILASTGGGFALPLDDLDGFAQTIKSLIERPEDWIIASRAGIEAAPRFSYDHYLSAVRQMFQDAWGDSLPAPSDLESSLQHEVQRQQ